MPMAFAYISMSSSAQVIATDVTKVEINIFKTLINVKKRTWKKEREKMYDKNSVTKICNQSKYYLVKLSHVACQIATRILMSTNKTQKHLKKEKSNSPIDDVMQSS